jgi:hypothetical protein
MITKVLRALMIGVVVVAGQPGSAGAEPARVAVASAAPAASWAGGRLDVFQVVSGSLWRTSSTGSGEWTPWSGSVAPVGGIGSKPNATGIAGRDRVDVFVTGAADGHLRQKTWSGGQETGWVDLGGVLTAAPAASWTANGDRVDVFGVGTDSRLYQKTWTGSGGWTDWVAFAAPAAGIGSDPSVTWTANGRRLDVFVTGAANGHLLQKSWNAGSGWSGWVDLGGVLTSAPSAQWTPDGSRIDVFGVGTDSKLYQKTWTSSGGWTGWTGVFGPAPGAPSAPAATWAADGSRLDVFVAGGPEGHVFQRTFTGPGGWTEWVDLG